MALSFLNTLSLTNIGLQGMRVYGRIRNKTGAGLIDFGNIENVQTTLNEQANNLQSARNGVRATVKVLTQSSEAGITFESLDVTDPTILAIHAGSDTLPIQGVTGGNIAIRVPGGTTEMELMILEPGAPGTDSSLLYVPRVQIKGNGGTPSNGENAARKAFTVTELVDETYKVPATVLASNPVAKHGVVAALENTGDPIADLHSLIEKLIAPLDAEGGP